MADDQSITDHAADHAVRVFGIVPAAGRSRRMGMAKQMLYVDGRPMLRSVIDPLAASTLDGIMLVTHSAIAAQFPESTLTKTRIVINDDESSEMIDSIRMGISAWQAAEAMNGDAGILICPADQPGLGAEDIELCLESYRREPGGIVIATCQGQRGHPIIFPTSMSEFVNSSACDHGLRALPRRYGDFVRLVDCTSPGVIRNINTPEDYDRLT